MVITRSPSIKAKYYVMMYNYSNSTLPTNRMKHLYYNVRFPFYLRNTQLEISEGNNNDLILVFITYIIIGICATYY